MKKFVFIFVFFVIAIAFVSANYYPSGSGFTYSKTSYTQPGFVRTPAEFYGRTGSFDSASCQASQDFLIQIAPGGCTPQVVRSDLLAEQDVYVFCKLQGIKINPVVETSSIRDIRLSHVGPLPPGVRGISFYRPKTTFSAGHNSQGFFTIDNLGYAVIILNKQPNERNLTQYFAGNISARVSYSAFNAVGMGVNEIVAPVMSDAEWQRDYIRYGFLNNDFYLRVDSISGDNARVSIYRDKDTRVESFTLKKGETSPERYLPGFDCRAGYTLTMTDTPSPGITARINFDGDEYMVYQNSKFADDMCQVSLVESYVGGGGRVTGRCNGKPFNLIINAKPVTLSVDGADGNYQLEQKIKENIWLMGGGVKNNGDEFVVLYTGENIDATARRNAENLVKRIERESSVSPGENFQILYKSNEDGIQGIKLISYLSKENRNSGDSNFETNYNFAYLNYTYVESEYGNLQSIDNSGIYGRTALREAFRLAVFGEKYSDAHAIANILREKYGEEVLFSALDYTNARDVIDTGDRIYGISLISVDSSSVDELGVQLIVDGIRTPLKSGDVSQFPEKGSVQLSSFARDSAVVDVTCAGDNNRRFRETIALGQRKVICGMDIFVSEINHKDFVKIRFNTKNNFVGGETNFSYQLAVETRNFELSPEKTLARIQRLNETIAKWENANEKLGNVVSGMKAACFATSAVLQVKNLLGGLGGEALARNAVMTDPEFGWNAICERAMSNQLKDEEKDLVEQRTYQNVEECIMVNSDKIEQSVQFRKQVIQDYNLIAKNREKDFTESTGGLFGGSFVKTNEYLAKSVDDVKRDYSNIAEFGDKVSKLNEYHQNNLIDVNDMREIELNLMILQKGNDADPVSKQMAEQRLNSIFSNVDLINDAKQQASSFSQTHGSQGFNFAHIVNENSPTQIYQGYRNPTLISVGDEAIPQGTPMTGILHEGKKYAATLEDQGNGKFIVKDIYSLNEDNSFNSKLDEGSRDSIRSNFPIFIEASPTSFNRRIEDPKVVYYEAEPYKGMPAIVPFDVQRGWYAATTPSVNIGGSGTFKDSGLVNFFWICHVGDDGRVNFQGGGGGDICQSYFVGQPVVEFSGLSIEETRRLVQAGERALRDAAAQYRSGVTEVNIGGSRIKVGDPAALISGTKCTDFMSARDCSIMFNVCDPVICPNSRCNLGGKFYVDDVVQTGVVGGLFLCLPNFGNPSEGGVIIPLCLSGIHAGIDNYVSIMKAYQSCLQESLETGAYTGICDQVSAVYKCEFFWRQISPMISTIVPRALEFFTGSRYRGGGEYLTVQSSWDNMQQSINYFNNVYAVNAMQAFRIRSTQEAGTEVCKGFVSLKYANKFKTLIEPDSPVQFSAWFTETPMTTATVPPTSHYKIYYHIFAGNDAGAYYSVYLKNRQGESFYDSSTGSVIVHTGFIPRGEYADESRDFTAPSGYTELCVRVNGKDTCGFKQVSTDFAINYMRDKYMEQQATRQNIRTVEECISGSPNALAMLNPNIQGGAEEAISPSVYNRGLIRICASSNPGATTDPERWEEVGVCGNTGTSCWLDKNSVQDIFTAGHVGAVNRTLGELDKIVEEVINSEAIKILEDSTLQNFDLRGNSLEDLGTKLDELNKIENEHNIITNEQRGMLGLLRARIHDAIARLRWVDVLKGRSTERGEEGVTGVTPTEVTDQTHPFVSLALQEYNSWRDGALNECDSSAQPLLTKYYDSVGYTGWNCGTTPWSGAFISYIIKQTSVRFPHSASHSTYFSLIRDNPQNYDCVAKDTNFIFDLKIGDILCNCRDSGCPTSFSSLQAGELGHCAIVMEKNENTLKVISGNRGDTVKIEIIDLVEVLKQDSFYYGFLSCNVGGSQNNNLPIIQFGFSPISETDCFVFEPITSSSPDVFLSPRNCPNTIENSLTPMVYDVAKEQGVNFNLLRAKIAVESNWNAQARSSAGAVGLMQIMEITYRDVQERGRGICNNYETLAKYSFRDMYNAEKNVQYGACYFKILYERNNIKDIELLLAAYNWGPTSVARNCEGTFDSCRNVPTETSNHVSRVLDKYREYELTTTYI